MEPGERKKSRIELQVPREVAKLLKTLKSCGLEPYLVGGFVRDSLMGRAGKDVDIALRDFEAAKRCLSEAGYRVLDVGESFRVLKVVLPGLPEPVDVAGFRAETYDMVSRKPVVAPVSTIEEDLGRRDFTINAIAVRVEDVDEDSGVVEGVLVDPYGGLEDLEKGVVRAVGDARVRFLEDPLRMLRAVRFAAKFGFDIDEKTAEAIRELRHELRRVSIERIRDELEKCFTASPSRCFKLLLETGLLEVVLPDLFEVPEEATRHDSRAHHHGETLVEHTYEALANLEKLRGRPSFDEILAVLLHDLAKQVTRVEHGGKVMFPRHDEAAEKWVERILRRLRLPREYIRKIPRAVATHMKVHDIAAKGFRRDMAARWWVWDVDEDPHIAHLAITIAEADVGKPYTELRRLVEEFENTPRALTGIDVVEMPIPVEKRSYVLRKARELQLARGYDKETLKKQARGFVAT